MTSITLRFHREQFPTFRTLPSGVAATALVVVDVVVAVVFCG